MRVCPIKLLSGLCRYYLKDRLRKRVGEEIVSVWTLLALSRTACVPLRPSSKSTLTCNRPRLSDTCKGPSNPPPWGGGCACGCDAVAVAAWRQRRCRGGGRGRGFKVRLFNGSSSGPCCEVGLTSLRPVWLTDWLTNSYWEYLSFKCVIHAGTDLKGTGCLGVRYVNKSGSYFLFVNVCWSCYVQFLFFAAYPMHMDCIYLVPSISSFHIVYFCGMYVPVKMQNMCFYFQLAIYVKRKTNKQTKKDQYCWILNDNVSISNFPWFGKHKNCTFFFFFSVGLSLPTPCALYSCSVHVRGGGWGWGGQSAKLLSKNASGSLLVDISSLDISSDDLLPAQRESHLRGDDGDAHRSILVCVHSGICLNYIVVEVRCRQNVAWTVPKKHTHKNNLQGWIWLSDISSRQPRLLAESSSPPTVECMPVFFLVPTVQPA